MAYTGTSSLPRLLMIPRVPCCITLLLNFSGRTGTVVSRLDGPIENRTGNRFREFYDEASATRSSRGAPYRRLCFVMWRDTRRAV